MWFMSMVADGQQKGKYKMGIQAHSWEDLEYWKSREWEDVKHYIMQRRKKGTSINPPLTSQGREQYLKAFQTVKLTDVKVVMMGQDPYPNPEHATGIAFHTEKGIPPTLRNIFVEYFNDLHYELPTSGNLSKWMEEGVFLWNAIPTCTAWGQDPLHRGIGWWKLSEEIVSVLSQYGVVFILMGSVARELAPLVDLEKSRLIETSHPSPRASKLSRHPFFGSRPFSTANALLLELGKTPVDWRL